MFDDLRNDAAKQYEDEFEEEAQQPVAKSSFAPAAPRRARSPKLLGMTSLQRFVLLFLLLIATCMLSFFCLFITGKIAL
ncbi:MAG: hypothetical protein LC099_10620 [Anaerolineales bacterium]|nr:hypothetical protein [Anaerolineales bacterium]